MVTDNLTIEFHGPLVGGYGHDPAADRLKNC
jgi:hypothetical protein